MLFLFASTITKAQTSSNTVKYQITYNPLTQVYTAWVVPDYNVPNANNLELTEFGGTAQFSIIVPKDFVITNITDIKGIWTKTTDSDFRKLGPGQPGQVWSGLDPTLNYYLIGKAPSETNYGTFAVGVPVALFSFTGNGCYGVVKALPANNPFIIAADVAYSLNAGSSFYSRSGQPSGGNQKPLEQFLTTTGIPANCLPPLANPDTASTAAGISKTIIVLANDKANDGTLATLTNITTPIITALPTKGTVLVNLDGSIKYTPNLGSSGTDIFIYSICDKINVTTCDTAKVTISITGVPQAIPDLVVAVAGVNSTILILGNDKNADGTSVTNLTKITTPIITVSPTKGTATVQLDGSVKYTANAGTSGTDTFIYSICDKINTITGFSSSQGILDIEVVYNQLNSIPTTNSTHTAAFGSGETLAPGVYSISGAVSVAGTLTLDGGGDPNALFIIKSVAGAMNTGAGVSVVLTNGAKANNVFWIAGGALGLGANTTMQGTMLCHSGAVSVGAGSSIVGRLFTNAGIISLNATVASLPSPSTSTYANYGSLKPLIIFSSNGALSNTGNSNITGDIGTGSGAITGFGSPSILNGNIYNAGSTTSAGFAAGICDTALVTITITSAPQTIPDIATATAGISSTILILGNDKNADGTSVTNLTKITTPIITVSPTKGTATVQLDGSVKYTPNFGTLGIDTFIYSICDKTNTTICDQALVTITIIPAPQAIPDNAAAIVGISVNLSVLINDKNPDGTAVVDLTKITMPIVSVLPNKGTTTVNLNGSINYKANLGASGTDTFIYTICSILNPAICDTALVTIKLNQKPDATNDIAVTPAGKPVSGNVLTNDFDLDGNTLTVSTTLTTIPTKGTVILNTNGTYIYTPNAGASGHDIFCYQICDNGVPSACDTACVNIRIVPAPVLANNAPEASDDNTQTAINIPIIVNVKANDIDPDGFATLGTPTKLTNPTNGVVIQLPNGNFTYTPNVGFIGKNSFTYSICDNGTPSKCDTATVTVEVLPLQLGNQAPVALDDVQATISGVPVVIPVKNNDSDPDLNIIGSPTIINQPASGTVTVNGNGTLTYTPNNATFVGTATFKYVICDNGIPSKCDTAWVSVVVLAPNKVCLTPKAYLQGALLGVDLPNTLMRDDLRVKNLIPTTSPYSGGLTSANTTTSTVLTVTGNNAIVDWVFVELRSGTDSTLVIDSRSALIQRDGDIVDVDGTGSLLFSVANTGQYYLVVKHRNHLSVMSVKNLMSNICKVIDFSQISTPNFNLDLLNIINQPQVLVQQGKALWAGNALSDNDIIFQGTQNDVNIIYTQVVNAGTNFFVSPSYKLKGYYTGDIDMNGEAIFQGTGNDVEFIYENVIKNHTGNLLKLNYFKIKQQLP